jgi:hypothetical protein
MTVIPAKAGIQYAAASRLNHVCLWNTGSPVFAGGDGLAMFRVRNLNSVVASVSEAIHRAGKESMDRRFRSSQSR